MSAQRSVLVDVLIHHQQRSADSGCHCGWGVLGASWADHVAEVYEQALHGDRFDYEMTVWLGNLTAEEASETFDLVADLAHGRHTDVACASRRVPGEDEVACGICGKPLSLDAEVVVDAECGSSCPEHYEPAEVTTVADGLAR